MGVAVRSQVLVEHHLAGDGAVVVRAHVLGPDAERRRSGRRGADGDRDGGVFGDEDRIGAARFDRP